MNVIETHSLTKTYNAHGKNPFTALSDLTLSVAQGEIFGYLGPNGAGKTTTIRLLLDLIRPTSGKATLLGMDAHAQSVALHHKIGFLPGELNLWKNLTGWQVVNYLASVRGDEDKIKTYAREIGEQLSLDFSKRVREYSSGNKRKLGLVIALMHKPELLILDEPTNGLDPLLQQTFNQMMREIRAEGRTVFLSSHILAEVQAICDRVGILRDGRLQAVERVSDLTHTKFHWVTMRFREAVTVDRITHVENVSAVEAIDPHTLRFSLSGDWQPVLHAFRDQYVVSIDTREPSLEEIFLSYYGGEPTAKVMA